MARLKIKTGIEIWQGSPGAGKSYCVTERLLRVVLAERRPVYTNLPLRLRVIRKYLELKRGGDVAARYVKKLDVEHFMRFLIRNQRWTDFKEQHAASGMRDREIEQLFNSEFGEPQTEGASADWFPPASVFLLDELHRWFSQRVQDTEPPELLNYLTMHRHHLHWIMVMTQNRMQLSVPWRENCVRLVQVTNKAELPFLFGLKFPLPAFFCEEYPKELIKIHSRDIDHGVRPTETWLRIPLFNGGLIWRLYDSFTHMGNQRQLEKRLRESQRKIEGEFYKEPVMPRRRGSRLWPLMTAASCCIAGASLVYALDQSRGKPKAVLPPGSPAVVAPVGLNAGALPPGGRLYQNGPTSQPVLDAHGDVIKEREVLFPYKVGAVSNAGCVVDGTYVPVSGFYNGWCLNAAIAEFGATLWSNDAVTVSVGVGGGVPRKIDRVRVPDDSRSSSATTRPHPATAEGPGAVDWFGSRAATRPSTQPAD